jgi:twitching motility protein PilT
MSKTGIDLQAYSEHIDRLVGFVASENASDLHLNAFYRPVIRVSKMLVPIAGEQELTHEDTARFLAIMLNENQRARFDEVHEIDFSYYNTRNKIRFRGHASLQRGAVSIALRYIPAEIRTLQELGVPEQLLHFTEMTQGFFLVVGPVGAG